MLARVVGSQQAPDRGRGWVGLVDEALDEANQLFWLLQMRDVATLRDKLNTRSGQILTEHFSVFRVEDFVVGAPDDHDLRRQLRNHLARCVAAGLHPLHVRILPLVQETVHSTDTWEKEKDRGKVGGSPSYGLG